MILADAINLPLVAALGLATFGPLTLLVTSVEALVFRFFLKTSIRSVFRPVLVANVISTLAGGLILGFQDTIIRATGIDESIPAFVRGYRWLGPSLIVVYFAKSVVVEGFWLTRRRFLDRVNTPLATVWRAVALGNVASYLILGPLFYVTTRPHFAGLETTFDAGWSTNADQVVYFIDRDTEFVRRKRLGGGPVRTLIPCPAWTFIVSEDESTFAYVGTNGNLYAYRAGDDEPILVSADNRECFMTTVSLSPDNTRIAYTDPPGGDSWHYKEGDQESLKVLDLESREVVEVGKRPARGWGEPIAWSAAGDKIFAQHRVRESQTNTFLAFVSQPPYGLCETRTTPPPQSQLVLNYGRLQGQPVMFGRRPLIEPRREYQAGGYEVETWPYLASALRIRKDGRPVLFLQNSYGLLNLSIPPLMSAVYLSSGDEFLLDWWDQTYLLSLPQRRLGLVANGGQFALRTRAFRVSFKTDGTQGS